jgi:hypothetical protein
MVSFAELLKLVAPFLPEWVWSCLSTLPIIVMIASALAAVTPTPADDYWVGKLYKVVDVFALNVGKAKQDCPKMQKVASVLEGIKSSAPVMDIFTKEASAEKDAE